MNALHLVHHIHAAIIKLILIKFPIYFIQMLLQYQLLFDLHLQNLQIDLTI